MIDHVIVHPDAPALAAATAARLVTALLDGQASRDRLHVALTGGRIGTAALAAVLQEPARGSLDLDRIHWWWSDERFLPSGDPERNETGARGALLDALGAPEDLIHPMPARVPGATAQTAAAAYAEALARHADPGADAPVFDVMLLGLGPDAHIASLFPGHPAGLAEGPAVIAVHGSPKPPPTRVSFARRLLHDQARRVWLLAAGQEKAGATYTAARTTRIDPQEPVSSVHGTEETLLLADVAAVPWYGSGG